MKLSALFIATIPLASAWHLQLYKNELYDTIIEDRSGSVNQPCKTLPPSSRNQVSSMKWDAAGSRGPCEIVLYDGIKCSGEALGRSRGNWNLPNFSSHANDKVDSYKINC